MKTHRLTALLTAVILLCLLPFPSLHVRAESGRIGDDITYTLQDDILTLTGTGATYSYKSRDKSPFWDMKDHLRGIVIGEGITEIGESVFALIAEQQTTVSLPDSLRRIGGFNFEGYYPSVLTLPPHLEYIGNSTFQFLQNVTELVIPDSVREIGPHAFSYAVSLRSVVLPDTDIIIGGSSFSISQNLEYIHLPDCMTEIPDNLFRGCTMLREIRIPEHCTRIGSMAFGGTGLTGVDIPAAVKLIGAEAFTDCRFLSSITLHEGLETLGDECFAGCRAKEIHVPESVRSIGKKCFPASVGTLTLPTGRDLEIAEGALPEQWAEAQEGFLILGDGILYQYRSSSAPETLVVPDGVKVIYPGAFQSLQSTSLILPASVRELRPHAVKGGNVTEITIQPETEIIPSSALADCTALKTIKGEYYSAAHAAAAEMKLDFVPLHPEDYPAPADPETENLFSFQNTAANFGPDYSMPPEAEALLKKTSSSAETTEKRLRSSWSGSCFGMSVVTLLVQSGLLPVSLLDPEAETLHDVRPSEQACGVINFYHQMQHSVHHAYYVESFSDSTEQQLLARIARYAADYNRGGSPYVISFLLPVSGGHAVLGYGIEQGEWTWDGRQYDRRIRIWDSNYAGLDDRCCLYFDAHTLSYIIPVQNDTEGGRKTAIAEVSRSTAFFNHTPYPGSLVAGDLDGNSECTAADAVLLARCINEDSSIDASVYLRMPYADLDGNDLITQQDLFLLLSRL